VLDMVSEYVGYEVGMVWEGKVPGGCVVVQIWMMTVAVELERGGKRLIIVKRSGVSRE
jgi:hypothetical protein